MSALHQSARSFSASPAASEPEATSQFHAFSMPPENTAYIPPLWLIEDAPESTYSAFPVSLTSPRSQNFLFGLSITSRTAYALPLASTLVRYFKNCGWADEYQAGNIETCLHEALHNAIVHGNLEITGGFEDDAEFDRFYENVDKRLATPLYGRRRVSIELSRVHRNLCLQISHTGAAYSGHSPNLNMARKSGRGLSIINELAQKTQWRHNGHTLELYFEAAPANPALMHT